MDGMRLLFSDPINHPGIEVWGGLLSPELARDLLTTAGISAEEAGRASRARYLSREMAAGRWLANGESIIVHEDLSIGDGKVRLAACAACGVPIPALVVKGVPDAAKPTIGTHKRRSTADTMIIGGDLKAKEKLAMANILSTIANGKLGNINSGRTTSVLRVNQIFELHPGLEDSLQLTHVLRVGPLTSRLLAVFHYVFSLVNARKAKDFIGHLGHHRSSNKAVRATKAAIQALESGTKHARLPAVALLLKGWQAYCEGDEDAVIEFGEDEEMPAIHGLGLIEMPEERPEPEPVMIEEAAALNAKSADAYLQDKIVVGIHTFDSGLAERTLAEKNGPLGGSNRPMSKNKVKAYARDLEAGRWPINGQALKFSRSNRLIDGQHRLAAVAQTGLPLTTLAVFNLDDSVFPTLDNSASRTLSSVLKSRGIVEAKLYQGILTLLSRHHLGIIGDTASPVTASDMLEALDRHRAEIDRSVLTPVWDREYGSAVVSGAIAHAAHVILRGIDPDAADGYMGRILNNENLVSGGTEWQVNRELSIATSNRRSKGAMTDKSALAIIFEGWNRSVAGGAGKARMKEVAAGPLPELLSPNRVSLAA